LIRRKSKKGFFGGGCGEIHNYGDLKEEEFYTQEGNTTKGMRAGRMLKLGETTEA
jgi:hypothetical protein